MQNGFRFRIGWRSFERLEEKPNGFIHRSNITTAIAERRSEAVVRLNEHNETTSRRRHDAGRMKRSAAYFAEPVARSHSPQGLWN